MLEKKRHLIDLGELPNQFPTNFHEPEFWEALGRAVATFGFLEETLAKAIFAFTATRTYREEEIEKALDEWLSKLRRALSDQLGNLIRSFEKEVRAHPDAAIENLDDLLRALREASKIRNVICHGSWPPPNSQGASVPFFINQHQERFEIPIDISFLKQLQLHVSELICSVIDTVIFMGWQLPGSSGPGKPI